MKSKKVNDTRTLEEKIDSLRKLGVNITIVNDPKDIDSRTILGTMKDDYPNLRITKDGVWFDETTFRKWK